MSARERNLIKQQLKHIALDPDHPNPNEFFYKRSSQDYNPDWVLQKAGYTSLNYQEALRDQPVQKYSQVGQEGQALQKTYQLLKNQTVGCQFTTQQTVQQQQQQQQQLDELQQAKLALDKGTVLSKPFAFKQSNNIQYPQHGMKVGNPLYESEYMNIGKEVPKDAEISNKFYPRSAEFTKSSTGNYKNNSLNCAWTLSKVHKNLNEF